MNHQYVFFIFALLCVSKCISTTNPVLKCPQLPPHTPRDIHDLAPSNIQVIMALGDSITAGFGAMGREGLLDEYRGIPGAIGGDEGQLTLPNFLKFYNPDIVGHSYGYHLIEIAGEESHYVNDVLNAAQSGATTDDFADQVNYLISQLSTMTNVSIEKDYKMLTFFIGANDACDMCKEANRPSVEQGGDMYEKNIRNAIQMLYTNVPRTIVNMIPLFNISGVYNVTKDLTYCYDLHEILPFECGCLFRGTDDDRQYLDDLATEYSKRLIKISNEWKAKNDPNFAVIYQPYTIGFQIEKLGISYLSTLDCFHPSLLAHQMLTVNGWNSIITSFDNKKWTFDSNVQFQCADQNSRIWTN